MQKTDAGRVPKAKGSLISKQSRIVIPRRRVHEWSPTSPHSRKTHANQHIEQRGETEIKVETDKSNYKIQQMLSMLG